MLAQVWWLGLASGGGNGVGLGVGLVLELGLELGLGLGLGSGLRLVLCPGMALWPPLDQLLDL